MLNNKGGRIFIGIKEEEHGYSIQGNQMSLKE